MENLTITIVAPMIFILLVGANYLLKAHRIKKEYTKYINDINNAEDEKISFAGEIFNRKILTDEGLKLALSNFIKSAKGKTVDINTEVIIESSLNKKIIENERKVENGGAVCIAWGLLGTFAGLTAAIFSTKDAMDASSNSMQAFVSAMGGPIEGMSLAFLTTIVGVLCSLAINRYAGQMRLEKDAFYSLFEDYLDNYIFSKYYCENEEQHLLIETFKEGLTVMTESFEKNMNNVVDKIENVFSDKMENIIDKIELNNEETRKNVRAIGDFADDIRRLVKKFDETVSGISATTDDLNKTISSLEKPINSFGNQIDKLEKVNKTFVEDLDKSMENFNGNLDKSMNNFNEGIDKGVTTFNDGIASSILEFNDAISKAKDSMTEENERFAKILDNSIESLNHVVEKSVLASKDLGESIEQNNKINEELSVILNKEIDMLNKTNTDLLQTIKKMSNNADTNSQTIEKEIERLNHTYTALNDFITNFETIIESIQVKSGEVARKTINDGIENLSDKITKKFDPTIENLEKSVRGSLEASEDLIKVTSVMNETIADISTLVSDFANGK